MHDQLFKKVFLGCFTILLIVLLCRFSAGGGAVLLAVLAIIAALSGRLAYALSAYCLFAFMIIMSNYVLPKTAMMAVAWRLAPLGITLGLMISAGRRTGRNQLPLGMLWPYLGVACLSSATGYCPIVSYLKLFNFAVLLAGLHVGLRNIDHRPEELVRTRIFILALVVFMVVGSLATLPFPAIAYATSMSYEIYEEGMEAANAFASEMQKGGGLLLFAGLTNQSQALGIMMPCALAWLLCDMLFVERRITAVHVISIGASFPMLYMCRSRTAFVAGSVAVAMVCGYCMKRIRLPQRIRQKMRSAVWTGLILLFGVMGYMQIKDQSISKFLRKYEAEDTSMSMTEAFTKTRMGKVEENMADFRSNPLFGTGFQVVHYMKGMTGIRLSAPIEKGVLPTVVLGETGIVGGVIFAIFLFVFYGTCIRKRYFCTMTMMSTFLATNLSEATFFSPGGVGGVMWIFCGVGGFVEDMIVQNRHKRESVGVSMTWR